MGPTISNAKSKRQEPDVNPPKSEKIETSGNSVPSKAKESAPAHHTSAFTDRKVAHRNAALNAMGGVRIDVYVRCRPPVDREGHEAIVVAVEDRDKTCVLTKDPDNEHRVQHRYSFDKVSKNITLFRSGTIGTYVTKHEIRGLVSIPHNCTMRSSRAAARVKKVLYLYS